MVNDILETGARLTIEGWPGEGIIGAPLYDAERNMVGEVAGVGETPDQSGRFVMAVRIFDTNAGRRLIHAIATDINKFPTIEGADP